MAAAQICKYFNSICKAIEGFTITQDPTLDDNDRFQVYMSHFPSSASMQSLVHYGQAVSQKTMTNYDWGKTENQKHYNQDTPPEINLSNIDQVPVAMFVGTKDDLGDVKDCEWARDQIKSIAHYEEVEAGHASFLIGKDMSYFDNVMKLVSKYNPVV